MTPLFLAEQVSSDVIQWEGTRALSAWGHHGTCSNRNPWLNMNLAGSVVGEILWKGSQQAQ